MADAALLSLTGTIDSLLIFSRISDSPISIASSTEESLQSAWDEAAFLSKTLSSCSEGVTDIEEQIIIDEAQRLEDAIEFFVPPHVISQSGFGETFTLDLLHLVQDLHSFAETAKEMQEKIEGFWEQKVVKIIEEYVEELFVQDNEEGATDEEMEEEGVSMVGLSDQFLQIRDILTTATGRDEYHVSIRDIVIWISGMAGIGKTMLAKKLFHDPSVKANFECQAFVTVGKEFWLKEVFKAIMDQLNLDNEKIIMEEYEDFHISLCRILTVKKSLVVLDDVWGDFIPGDLINEQIKDVGSRILFTSRKNARYVYLRNLKMRFMNEEESWELLRQNLFGEEECCPPLLVKPGKKIAEKCEGLPLLIIAVAPILLSKAKKNPECWKRVAEKPHLVLEDASFHISEIMWKSYQVIDEEQKMSFLYIAAFPQSCIVRRSTLTNLWYAESYSSVNNYSKLNAENLVVGHQKSWYGERYKACRLHCTYWYLCKREAQNKRFLYIISSFGDGFDERVKSNRRLAIYSNVLLAIKELHNKIASISTVRSLLCTGPYHQYQVPVCWEWKLLRILHA